jgi:hypothetical protein
MPVFQASPHEKPVLGGDDPAERIVRQFGRLRRPPVPQADPALADQLQRGVMPVDSAKTFVGPNGTYYDERWRWMEWRGLNRSWNWSAALSFGGWLAYRRFYGLAALYLGWLGLLLFLALEDTSLHLLAAVQLLVAAIVGVYGNTLYMLRFRRMSWKAAEGQKEYAERLEALAAAGGVDRRAVWIMELSGVGLGALLIGLDG